jgi:hypothetical protein
VAGAVAGGDADNWTYAGEKRITGVHGGKNAH